MFTQPLHTHTRLWNPPLMMVVSPLGGQQCSLRLAAPLASAVNAAAIKLQAGGCVSVVRKCLSIFIDVCSDVFQSCHCCVLFFLRQMIIKGNPCLDPPGLVRVVICKCILSIQEEASVSTISLKPEHLNRTFVNIVKAHFISLFTSLLFILDSSGAASYNSLLHLHTY